MYVNVENMNAIYNVLTAELVRISDKLLAKRLPSNTDRTMSMTVINQWFSEKEFALSGKTIEKTYSIIFLVRNYSKSVHYNNNCYLSANLLNWYRTIHMERGLTYLIRHQNQMQKLLYPSVKIWNSIPNYITILQSVNIWITFNLTPVIK